MAKPDAQCDDASKLSDAARGTPAQQSKVGISSKACFVPPFVATRAAPKMQGELSMEDRARNTLQNLFDKLTVQFHCVARALT